jgi:hypothetical protein
VSDHLHRDRLRVDIDHRLSRHLSPRSGLLVRAGLRADARPEALLAALRSTDGPRREPRRA